MERGSGQAWIKAEGHDRAGDYSREPKGESVGKEKKRREKKKRKEENKILVDLVYDA